MKYISLLALGLILVAVSVPNLRGSASTIKRYNRRRVSREDTPRYARAMGAGTLIMGVCVTATAVLQMIFDAEPIFYLTAAGVAVGLTVMVYAQFRYNEGDILGHESKEKAPGA